MPQKRVDANQVNLKKRTFSGIDDLSDLTARVIRVILCFVFFLAIV
jgi:hypothetical protein